MRSLLQFKPSDRVRGQVENPELVVGGKGESAVAKASVYVKTSTDKMAEQVKTRSRNG